MKRRIILCLAALLLAAFAAALPLGAAAPAADDAAAALHALHLVAGTSSADGKVNFDLDAPLSRAQAVTLVVRFLGAERAALDGDPQTPFDDLPAWARPYVGYAYANGIAKGTSATKFDADAPISRAAFLTSLLRVLGYADKNDGSGDFVWSAPGRLALAVGLTDDGAPTETFTRGDAFLLCRAALEATPKSGETLSARLTAAGVFTAAEYDAVRLKSAAVPTEPKTEILPIAALNQDGTDGDHMDDDFQTASVEADFRTKVLLNESTTGNFRYGSAWYPRVKQIRDDLYLLLYHYTRNGQHLYYAISRDAVHWGSPKVLYDSAKHKFTYTEGSLAGQTDGYHAACPDAVVLPDGDILCAYSVRPFKGYTIYNELSGIDIVRGKVAADGSIAWSAPTRVYTGQNWEVSFLLQEDRIELYFTQIAPYIEKYGYDTHYRTSGTGMLISRDGGYSWTPTLADMRGEDYRATTVFQQATGTRNGLPYFCGQMPVAVRLATGKTLLATEIRSLDDTAQFTISYALSGEDGMWKPLALTEAGPDTTVQSVWIGTSPFLARFLSGEVVMTYARGNRLRARMGAPDGSAFSQTLFTILPDAAGIWGCVETVDSHAMLFANAAHTYDEEGKLVAGGIAMVRGYLNHRIDAPQVSICTDGYTNDWNGNTDALFVGSESQAQVTLRAAHDADNLYFLLSRLDDVLTSDDTVTVCIAASTTADYRITVGLDGIRKIELYENSVCRAQLSGGTAAVRVLGTVDQNDDRDTGCVYEVAVPKALLGLTGADRFKVRLALSNTDGKDVTVDSMGVSVYSTALWPAVVLK